jgi:hypothetical protein
MLRKTRTRQISSGAIAAVILSAVAMLAIRTIGPTLQSARASNDSAGSALNDSRATGVAAGFSALNNQSLRPAPTAAVENFQSLHSGNYSNAKAVASDIYLAAGDGTLCLWVQNGLGGCTDALNAGDAWIAGDMIRESDTETAPLKVRLYGVARDDVKSIEFARKSGDQAIAVLKNNTFDVTLHDTSFADLTGITLRFVDGSSVNLDPADYFPQNLPKAPKGVG